jgi:hypothetical protein
MVPPISSSNVGGGKSIMAVLGNFHKNTATCSVYLFPNEDTSSGDGVFLLEFGNEAYESLAILH